MTTGKDSNFIKHKCYLPLKKLSIQKHKSFTGLHFLRYLVNCLKEWERVISGELDTSEWYLTSYFSKKDVVERHQYCLESSTRKPLTEMEERDPSFLIFESGRHKCATALPATKLNSLMQTFFPQKQPSKGACDRSKASELRGGENGIKKGSKASPIIQHPGTDPPVHCQMLITSS